MNGLTSDFDGGISDLIKSSLLAGAPLALMTAAPWLALLLAGPAAHAAWSDGRNAKLALRRFRAVQAGLRAVSRRLSQVEGVREDEVLDVLQRPDMLRLLACARDHFAMAQYENQLRRFNEVLANRALRAHDPIDVDLRLAKAALDLSDEGIVFLEALAQRKERGQTVGETITTGPLESRSVAGATFSRQFLAALQDEGTETLMRGVEAIRVAESHGLITKIGVTAKVHDVLGPPGGGPFHYSNELWVITPWGEELVRVVRGAGGPEALKGDGEA